MDRIQLEDYKNLIREERTEYFPQPYDLVYENFVKLDYDKFYKNYFLDNASNIVEDLRKNCWDMYYPAERKFTSKMLKKLVEGSNISHFTPIEAIAWFLENYPEHIYAFALSNTQSRRSRAGKEFESIIELLLIGAGIPLDSQGNIGKNIFLEKGLGKLVDVVSPGVVEYTINKRNTILISAKTTLRERWQEVPEEISRTGAREMFLATLDTSISQDVLNTLYEANIQITTTERIKNEYYTNNDRVLTFEKLIKICLDNLKHWSNHNYSADQKAEMINSINKQVQKHKKHPFVENYYNNLLDEIKK